jgi:hypothetical protein
MRTFLAAALAVVLAGTAVAAQQPRSTAPAPARAEVLVLGTYHMANPGRDIFNTQADDVLAPKRQAEIAQLVEVLERFRPTKIAIESSPWGNRPAEYADYLAGKRELTQNEIEQLGFRLAKKLDHKAIYPVDVDGDFPYLRLMNYAKSAGREKEMEALRNETGEMVKAQNAYLASHTILEMLLLMNSDESSREGVAHYYKMAHFGEPGDWAGADLLAEWYKRNIRIFSNIVKLVDSPDERILVIYGAGHLGWLQEAVENDPDLRLRKLSEFVNGSVGAASR